MPGSIDYGAVGIERILFVVRIHQPEAVGAGDEFNQHQTGPGKELPVIEILEGVFESHGVVGQTRVQIKIGRPGGIRTPNTRIWSPVLYQFELLACKVVGGNFYTTEIGKSLPKNKSGVSVPYVRPVRLNSDDV